MPLPTPLDRIHAQLRAHPLDPGALASPDALHPLKPGAVLILMYPHADEAHMVLTLRPGHLRRHAGQVSLPGGRFEPSDGTLLTTALRETEEELGVPRESVEVWGVLPHSVITVSQYRITPFVGYTQRRPEFSPDPGEVAEVLEVPISFLADAASMKEEPRELSGGQRLVSFYPWGPHKIWGATARVLGQFVRLIDTGARQPHEL